MDTHRIKKKKEEMQGDEGKKRAEKRDAVFVLSFFGAAA